MKEFYSWDKVDSNLYATRGQLLDKRLELSPNIQDHIATVTVNASLQTFKLYGMSLTKPLSISPNHSSDDYILDCTTILGALYVINNYAKTLSKYISKNSNIKSERGKIEKYKKLRQHAYMLKAEVLGNMYGENRIKLNGYHTIGTDKRKAYEFIGLSYSFHNWAESFNIVEEALWLGHLSAFPSRGRQQIHYSVDIAQNILSEYVNKYIEDETVRAN
ncbi:hypothetical protein [Priestia megaterium]